MVFRSAVVDSVPVYSLCHSVKGLRLIDLQCLYYTCGKTVCCLTWIYFFFFLNNSEYRLLYFGVFIFFRFTTRSSWAVHLIYSLGISHTDLDCITELCVMLKPGLMYHCTHVRSVLLYVFMWPDHPLFPLLWILRY